MLSEISAVLRARQDIEAKLARAKETSVEQRRRSKAEEDKFEREKQELSYEMETKLAEFKAEEERRVLKLEEEAARIKAESEAEIRRMKEQEERRRQELEEKAARIKEAAAEEARRTRVEEEKIELERQKLEESIARVKVTVPFSSVLNATASNPPSAFASPRSLPPTYTDASIEIDQEAFPTATTVELTHQHTRDAEVAKRELGPWFRRIGFDVDTAQNLLLRFSRPDYGVTNCALMFSLEEEDADIILEGCPLGHKRAIKNALKREKKELERL